MLQVVPETVLGKYQAFGAQFAEFLLVALVVYLFGRYAAVPVVVRAADRFDVDPTLANALEKSARLLVVVVALAFGAAAAGFHAALGGSALVLAALSLAVGFAAQDVLSNFVAGIFIVQNPRLNVGDTIAWDDRTGVIRDIGFRSTRVRAADNETVIVPNTDLATSSVRNLTINDPIGLSYGFGIGYGDDVELAIETIAAAAAEHDAVLEDPGPEVQVTDLAETAVVLTARVKIPKSRRDERGDVRATMLRRAHERCREVGVDLSTTHQHDVEGEVAVAGEVA